MIRERTYYDLFGVSPNASARQIRDAYLKLLKQHHPDLAPADPGVATPELVAVLNRCYAILKDPQKRAAYDAGLARSSPPGPAAAMAHARHVIPATARAHRRMPALLLVAGAAGAVALAAQFAMVTPGAPLSGSLGGLWVSDAPTQSVSARVLLRDSDVRRQARLATLLSSEGAVSWSRRCFEAAAREQRDLSAAELCVIFDQAFLYWRKSPGDYPILPIYFNQEVARVRYARALLPLGSRTEGKVQELRDRAFRALLAEVGATLPADEPRHESRASLEQPAARAGAAEASRNGT